MKRLSGPIGTLLYAVGMVGLLLIVISYVTARVGAATEPTPRPPVRLPSGPPGTDAAVAQLPGGDDSEEGATDAAEEPPPPLLITRLRLPRIQLEADVVEAPFVDQDGGTWDVPRFKAGHAEFTANAGEVGNSVLLGHLTSLTLGNVFEHLDAARVGDQIQIYSDDRMFDYRVVDVRRVTRTDASVLNPTDSASVSLITCAGIWLPLVHDYSERLVVRGQLVADAAVS